MSEFTKVLVVGAACTWGILLVAAVIDFYIALSVFTNE